MILNIKKSKSEKNTKRKKRSIIFKFSVNSTINKVFCLINIHKYGKIVIIGKNIKPIERKIK